MGMSVLVVGGAGYIGSHMCQVLRDAGHHVTVFDNLSRGHRDAVGDSELVVGDIRSESDLQRCLAGRRFDLAMHFAALAYVGESVLQPARYYDNNVCGSLTLMNALLQARVNRMVFSSSCAVYGEVVHRPMNEEHPLNPVNPYGRTKLMVEQALQDYAASHGFRSISLRYFNAAGCDPSGRLGERHEPETHLIPLVLQEALRVKAGGNPWDTHLHLFGTNLDTPDGTCVRDYIHVNDLCAAHLKAADRLMGDSTPGFEAFNLGNGEGYSVLQVLEACRRVTRIDIQYHVSARRPGDPLWLVGSAERARKELGWEPRTGVIDDIILTAWRWIESKSTIQSNR